VLTRRALLVLAAGAIGGPVSLGKEVAEGLRAVLGPLLSRALYALHGEAHTPDLAFQVLSPTAGPWVNNNLWGDQHFADLPQSAGIVVTVSPKNTKMHGPPHVHSVQLARSDETSGNNADMRARVTYGCGGIENSFDCDWFHGSQFTLVANSVDVKAVSFAPVGWHAYDPALGSLSLRASVAKGSINQSSQPLTYTEPQAFLTDTTAPATAFADFPVRDFAKSFTVHLTNDTPNSDPNTPTGVLLEILNGGNILAVYDAQVCAGGRVVPLPGFTTAVRIVNTSATLPVIPTLVWFLGL